jgi:hypothetical protein
MPDIVPPKKPYTTQQFQKKADLYIKGALGGFDKAEMKELLMGEIEKAKDAGILSTEEAMDFIRERSELLKEFIKENPGETLPDMTFVDGRVELKSGGNYWAMVTRMFIEAGAEEGTGMDINEFAAQYFPRENNSEGTTLEKLGDIVDVRNVPYYASKGLEGIVNASEMLSKLPFAAGKLTSDLLREVPNKKMFLDALENIQPGSFAEKIGLTDLITRQEENLSPETKTVGSQLSLGTETFVPVGAAFKLGEKIIKNASNKLGPIENNKSLEKIIDERLTDYGEGRRDFNKLVATGGLLAALKSIGLGNIGKTTKAGDDFKVSLIQDFDGEYVDETMVGYENLYTTIEPLTKKGKEILKKLKIKSSEVIPGQGDEVFINNGEDALIAIEKIKGQTDNIGLEIDVPKPKKPGEPRPYGTDKKTFRMGDNPQDVFEEAKDLTIERGPYGEFEYADEFTGDIVDTILNKAPVKKASGGRVHYGSGTQPMTKSEKWMRDYFFSGKGGYDDRMTYQEFAIGPGQELYKKFNKD